MIESRGCVCLISDVKDGIESWLMEMILMCFCPGRWYNRHTNLNGHGMISRYVSLAWVVKVMIPQEV